MFRRLGENWSSGERRWATRMFSVFGLISSGGEQVVGIVVYEGTPCLEKLSRLFSVLNTEDRNIIRKRQRKCKEIKTVPKPQTLETECAFSSPVFLYRSGFQWQCQREYNKLIKQPWFKSPQTPGLQKLVVHVMKLLIGQSLLKFPCPCHFSLRLEKPRL